MSMVGPQKEVDLRESNQPGSQRILKATVLERFPTIEKSSCSFPNELEEFFFEK